MRKGSMFKNGNSVKKLLALCEDFFAPFSKCLRIFMVVPFIKGLLKFYGNFGLVSFDNQIRKNSFEKLVASLACSSPNKLISVFGISFAMLVYADRSAEAFLKSFDNRSKVHTNSEINLISNVIGIGFNPARDTYVSFSVEKTGGISIVKHVSSRWDDGEVGGHPILQLQKGNTEPSRLIQPGVCNEHGPSAKAKMCSELGRNVEKAAEMIASFDVYSYLNNTSKVTDCNTKYIHWRPHAKRNMVPLDPDRFSVNQDAMVKLIGWAGNMTLSNAFLQGVLINT